MIKSPYNPIATPDEVSAGKMLSHLVKCDTATTLSVLRQQCSLDDVEAFDAVDLLINRGLAAANNWAYPDQAIIKATRKGHLLCGAMADETIRVLRTIAASAIAYLSDTGPCDNAPDDDEVHYCDDDDCTYCALARVLTTASHKQLKG